MSIASSRSRRTGRAAWGHHHIIIIIIIIMTLVTLRQSLATLVSVSSPASVVRSMQVTARSSQPACHCCFTVRRVPRLAARLVTRNRSAGSFVSRV